MSDSERVVIREIFQNPHISLDEIAVVLEKEREEWIKERERETGKKDKRFREPKEVDIRTISKFKSVGLKKIRKGLIELAETSRLDLSIQDNLEEENLELLQKNGILYGHDFRIDRKVYIFYTLKDGYILWQEHVCNIKCQDQCKDILNLIREEHELKKSFSDKLTREQFEDTFNEIIRREKP
ncbi:MAG: hypothetical protein ACFFBQ_08855 [Promethearchaeota archaeon]